MYCHKYPNKYTSARTHVSRTGLLGSLHDVKWAAKIVPGEFYDDTTPKIKLWGIRNNLNQFIDLRPAYGLDLQNGYTDMQTIILYCVHQLRFDFQVFIVFNVHVWVNPRFKIKAISAQK